MAEPVYVNGSKKKWDLENFEKGNKRAPGLKRSAWIEKYQQASFRGVEFFIESADNGFGRRIVTHEFPKRDNPRNEDLGRKAREFSFSAYIVGDDYFQHRNDLINALEKSGPGQLVHPYLGVFSVVCQSSRSTESNAEGRICRFDLQFIEDVAEQLTVRVINAKNDNYQKRQSFKRMVNSEFAETFSLIDDALSDVNAVVKAVDDVAYLLIASKKVVSAVPAFKNILNNLRGKIIQIIFDSEDLANELSGAILFGSDSQSLDFALEPVSARDQFNEYQNSIDSIKTARAELSPEDPDYQIYDLTLKHCLVGMSGLVSIMEFDSKQDAEEIRSTLFLLLDELLFGGSITDDLFAAINDMKASINIDFDKRIESLGELFEYNITDQSMNILAITHSIYGDLEKEEDILNRNKIQNPFFVTGPESLQVVINV
jgi:prophage DNA circulation protein